MTEEEINAWAKIMDKIAEVQNETEEEILSECCSRKIKDGTDLCSKCNEHTGTHNI